MALAFLCLRFRFLFCLFRSPFFGWSSSCFSLVWLVDDPSASANSPYCATIVTGSGKTDQLAQAIIFAIYIADDRAKNCLRLDMLSVHIPCSMPELCALETRSCKTAVMRNAHSKIAKLGKVR